MPSRLPLRLLFLGLLAATCLPAQSLVTCDNYDSSGKASGIHKEWDIQSTGSNIYILFSQPNTMSSGAWYLYIDHDWQNNGTFKPIETVKLSPRPGRKWYAVDQRFDRPGKYKAKVMYNGQEKATTDFTLYLAKDDKNNLSNDEEVDTDYYEDCTLIFCKSLDTEIKPVGEASQFKLGPNGKVNVTIFLDNQGKAFKTEGMQIDIYRKDTKAKYESFNIKTQKDWDYVKFVQEFNKPGVYTFDIYSKESVFIVSGDITITK